MVCVGVGRSGYSPSASAEVPREVLLQLALCRLLVVLRPEQRVHRHHETRGAEPALRAVGLGQRTLTEMGTRFGTGFRV